MIDENQFLSCISDQVPTGNRSHIFSFLVQNREIAVSLIFHNFFDIIEEIFGVERDQIASAHQIFDRNTLVNQTRNRIRVMRTADDHTAFFLCKFLNRFRHLCAKSDDNAACIHLDCTELVLRTVSENDKVIFFDVVLHRIRMECADNDFSADKISMLISDNNRTIQRIRDTAVLRPCQ